MSESKLPINFAIADVQTVQFAIIEAGYNESNTDIHLISGFKFGYNETGKTVMASPRFSFEQDGVSFLILEISCVFRIADESWQAMFNSETPSLTLPKGFAAHIAAIAIGAARGVLHAKTEQTPFNKFIIPLINAVENITEDVVLK
jgi:hypothetical protein